MKWGESFEPVTPCLLLADPFLAFSDVCISQIILFSPNRPEFSIHNLRIVVYNVYQVCIHTRCIPF